MLYSMFWTYHFFPLAAVVTSYVLSSLIKNLRAANLFSFRCHDYNGITVPVYVGLYIYIYIYIYYRHENIKGINSLPTQYILLLFFASSTEISK